MQYQPVAQLGWTVKGILDSERNDSLGQLRCYTAGVGNGSVRSVLKS